jgi:hypothetical protein
MTKDEALETAYLAGFKASGEGYNGEYPFGDHNQNPDHDPVWCKDRDNEITAIKEALVQPEQEFVRFVCTVIDNAHPHGIPLDQWVKPKQRTWVGLMRGVRVEREYVVISVNGGNREARELCAALIQEMNGGHSAT